jgi:predicted transposase YbfD/YdcC
MMERSLRMDAQATEEILRFFRGVPDPRAANARHRLEDILCIAVMAVMCGAQGWAAVEAWGLIREGQLKRFLSLPHGIPSHDTFDRVFAMLDPLKFEGWFNAFAATLVQNSGGQFVAVDGKTLRRSWKKAWSKTPVHMVSAFVAKNRLVLGQLACEHKSNEIMAIPKLLAMLNLAGMTVTIDAMGCQREIARQIVDQEGHYILAVKENQPKLHGKVTTLMDEAILDNFKGMRHGYYEQHDTGHGRIETRRVWVTDEVHWLGDELLRNWAGLSSLIVVESVRQDLSDLEGKVTTQRRYCISSHVGTDARWLGTGIRGHWGIENTLHWQLDVSMDEDQCRLRVDHGAENFSRLRRFALNKLKRWDIRKENGKVLKVGIKIKQQVCNSSPEALLQALAA